MEPISLAISAGSAIFGAIGSGRARREAMKRERAAAARLMALEANRQDIPDFGTDFENPFANLQVATRAAEMQAEQADISLASTLDTLRATGASAGGATALARAAAQSKRGVSAQIQQQEARNAQLRAQGEVQAQQLRQKAQMASFSAQERREMQQLNRQASIQSSASQQAAAYGAQSSAMIGAAVGALGSFAASGGFGAEGPFAKNTNTNTNFTPEQQASIEANSKPSQFTPDPYIQQAGGYTNYMQRADQNSAIVSSLGIPNSSNITGTSADYHNNLGGVGVSDEVYYNLLNLPIIR